MEFLSLPKNLKYFTVVSNIHIFVVVFDFFSFLPYFTATTTIKKIWGCFLFYYLSRLLINRNISSIKLQSLVAESFPSMIHDDWCEGQYYTNISWMNENLLLDFTYLCLLLVRRKLQLNLGCRFPQPSNIRWLEQLVLDSWAQLTPGSALGKVTELTVGPTLRDELGIDLPGQPGWGKVV